MNKDEFLKLLDQAKEDEYGNLYVLSKYNRVYFGTIATVCEDILEMADRRGHEIYDRHFWNDDTLKCKIVTTQEVEKEEIENKYFIPKRINKIGKLDDNDGYIDQADIIKLANKVDEIIDVLNKYEYIIETKKMEEEYE